MSTEHHKKAGATPRELLLVAMGILALLYGYMRFWHEPRALEIQGKAQALSDNNARLTADLATLETLNRQARLEAEALQAGQVTQNAQIDQVREMNSNFANIVRELTGAGSTGKFSIRNLAVSKEEKMADYTKVLFSLELDAPFLALGSFLERLEKSDLLTEVVDIQVTRIERELKRCTIKLSIYSYAARG